MNTRFSSNNSIILAAVVLAISLFLSATHFRLPPNKMMEPQAEGKVVIAAPIQILMYAGDRYLAANLEAIRVAAIGASEEESLAAYRSRAHGLVSELNPCHEDNYYLANAMLSWGGSVDESNDILQRATDCRYWDEIPPFFLGFNRYFFYRDLDSAKQAIDLAAARSEKNRAALQQMSIVMASKKLNDEKMALAYLKSQRDEATDPSLAEMLDRRLKRLEGLITLREAQTLYEKRYQRPLENPEELVSKGILESFPQDPMRIGYEFVDGRFRFRAANVGGLEIR